MADYTFRYRLEGAPEARRDGSGCVQHNISVEASSDGENWLTVPGRHASINVPASEVDDALAAGTSQQIITAYKNALVSNLSTVPQPITGWSTAQLEALMDANDGASSAATAIHLFITDTLGLSYPVTFTL